MEHYTNDTEKLKKEVWHLKKNSLAKADADSVISSAVSNAIENILPTLATQGTMSNAGTRSVYAVWKVELIANFNGTNKPLVMIGGNTPKGEGQKVLHFQMLEDTATNVFTNDIFYVGVTGLHSASTANGWNYAIWSTINSTTVIQVSNGVCWFAIGY